MICQVYQRTKSHKIQKKKRKKEKKKNKEKSESVTVPKLFKTPKFQYGMFFLH